MSLYCTTPAQANLAIDKFDISTYSGFLDAARALLADKPQWVALKDRDVGYLVMVNNSLACLPTEAEGYVYRLEDLGEPDISAWNSDTKCWDGDTQDESQQVLLNPIFVPLSHQRSAEVSAAELPGFTIEELMAMTVMPFNAGELREGESIEFYYSTPDVVTYVEKKD